MSAAKRLESTQWLDEQVGALSVAMHLLLSFDEYWSKVPGAKTAEEKRFAKHAFLSGASVAVAEMCEVES